MTKGLLLSLCYRLRKQSEREYAIAQCRTAGELAEPRSAWPLNLGPDVQGCLPFPAVALIGAPPLSQQQRSITATQTAYLSSPLPSP